MDNAILDRLSKVTDLPSFPEIVNKLSKAVQDPNTNANKVAAIMSDDPAITAKVLRLVNSAYYGRGGRMPEITSVSYAVTRLGLREIKNIVLTLNAFRLFDGKNSAIDLKNFWRHSVTTAVMTKVVNGFATDGVKVGETELDAYYVAGLLHEIGILVLNQYFRDKLDSVLSEMAKTGQTLQTVEDRLLGINHALIGGFIARAWRLPDDIVAAIENHHTPEKAPENLTRITRIVNLADYLSHIHGPHFYPVEDLRQDTIHLQSLKILNVPVKHISEIMDLVEEEVSKSEVLITLK